ncbi:venom carboxylesterase-6-like [Vanessa atalanta]|uniref:venom carboxylesterase-6-like n=1 Tax=Vanessa atalanta TaxID=42275 RepID=UPI001FCD1D50|nr:venom carboxylesterase-6-like [Vanessa atalanta]
MWLQGLVVCACAVLAAADQSWRIVSTDQGPVKGYRAPEGHFVFYGIPYATTPIGPNKFKPPLPPPSWDEPFEAIQKYVICPQRIRDRDTVDVVLNPQEDCLITNIYVPDTEETNLPVVVYFHGGSYQYGYGNIRTAINLLNSKKIIIVNFNFRIGAHGLLCLGTEDVPGNAGMKDQIALLRWVHRNIASFGGNPDDVTLNGWSAGSSAVDLVMISKLARGLFHKVIPESGSSTASFSVQVDPIANAKMIAKELNFHDVHNITALEDFYKSIPFETLYSVDVGNQPNSATVFAPCIERYFGQEMFLDDYPANILKSGNYPKVPMLYGVTEKEGMFRLSNFDKWKTMMNDNFADFLPEDLDFEREEEKEYVVQKIKHFYFGDEPVSERNVLQYVQYFTDAIFAYGTAKAVKLQVEAGNNQIYLYEYAYADENSDYIIHTQTRGATHVAQTNAVMDLKDEHLLSDAYKKVKVLVRDLWLNFITTGKPVPEGSSHIPWPPVGQNRTPFMFIDRDLTLKKHFMQDRALFWDEIYEKYYRVPVPPFPYY